MSIASNDGEMRRLNDELQRLTKRHSDRMRKMTEYSQRSMDELSTLRSKFEEQKTRLLKEQDSEIRRFEDKGKIEHKKAEDELSSLSTQITGIQNQIRTRQDQLDRKALEEQH